MLSTLPHIAAAGIRIQVAAPPTGDLAAELERRAIEHIPLDLCDARGQRLAQPAAREQIRAAILATRPDLVHANSLSIGRRLGRMADSLPVPSTSHLRDIIKLSGAGVRDLNCNSQLVAVSKATRNFHVAQGLDANRVAVIHNGIDVDRFARSGSVRESVRAELGIPDNAVVMLTAGQIGLRKGLDTLAAAAVAISQSVTGLHWLLAGERFSTKAESVEFERSVDQTFRSAEPQLTYHRLGWRSDLNRVMSAADVLVHTARQEPLGRVILEAAAAGLAIVATDVGGTSEIVRHGESALLVPPDAPVELADSVRRFVESSAERTQFGHAARQRIASQFQVGCCADALTEVWSRSIKD